MARSGGPFYESVTCVSCGFENDAPRAILGLAIVGVGNSTTTMTKEARPLTQEQRKEFVQLLKEAKTRVLETLSHRYSARYRKAWKTAVDSLMDKQGATEVFGRIMAAKKDLKNSEKTLRILGFQFDSDDDLELTPEGSKLHGRGLNDSKTSSWPPRSNRPERKYRDRDSRSLGYGKRRRGEGHRSAVSVRRVNKLTCPYNAPYLYERNHPAGRRITEPGHRPAPCGTERDRRAAPALRIRRHDPCPETEGVQRAAATARITRGPARIKKREPEFPLSDQPSLQYPVLRSKPVTDARRLFLSGRIVVERDRDGSERMKALVPVPRSSPSP